MPSPEKQSEGVSGTVNAFNFIRRIGFPSAPDIVSIFITITGLAAVVSLPLAGLGLTSTALVVLSGVIFPTILGEAISSKIILRGDPVLDFRRLMGMETLSWLPLVAILSLYSSIGTITGNHSFWINGLLVAIAVSLPVRFLTIFSMSSLGRRRKL